MDTNRAQLAYVAESTFNEIPATPAWQILRFKSEDLKADKGTVVSEEIRADRQISDLAKVSLGANGGFGYELSYGAFSTLIAAALGTSAVVVNETVAVTFAAAGQTITIDAGTWAVTPLPGQFIRISNAADAGNNGIKLVTAATSTVITLAAGSLTADESADTVTIRGTAYRNGVSLPTFTLERKTVTNAAADYFQRYSGMGVDEWNMAIGVGKITEGTFSFVGSTPTVDDAEYAGSTYTAAATNQVQNATSHIAAVYYGGALATEHLTALEFSIKNNLRAKGEIGSDTPFELGNGEFSASGKITAYFQDNTLYGNMINHTYSSVAWLTTDAAGNSMGFHFPRINFSPADPNVGGKNQDIMLDLPFQAIMDPTIGYTMIVTEIPAP
jgi:hypothetical protein